MTSWVTLSSARPRNPLRSPALIQAGVALPRPDVGGPSIPGELARQALRPVGERGAPGEAPAVVADLAKAALDRRAHAAAEDEPRALRRPLALSPGLQHHFDARADALGVRGEEVPEPPLDLVIAASGEHIDLLTLPPMRPGFRP